MEKSPVVLEKLYVSHCSFCKGKDKKTAMYRGIVDGEVKFFCQDHSRIFDKKKIKDLTILEKTFHSKSIAEVGGKFSNEHWKDFGLDRKNYYLKVEKSKEMDRAQDFFFEGSFLTTGKLIGKITNQKKTYEVYSSWFWEDYLLPVYPGTKIPVGILLDKQYNFIKYLEVDNGFAYDFLEK